MRCILKCFIVSDPRWRDILRETLVDQSVPWVNSRDAVYLKCFTVDYVKCRNTTIPPPSPPTFVLIMSSAYSKLCMFVRYIYVYLENFEYIIIEPLPLQCYVYLGDWMSTILYITLSRGIIIHSSNTITPAPRKNIIKKIKVYIAKK